MFSVILPGFTSLRSAGGMREECNDTLTITELNKSAGDFIVCVHLETQLDILNFYFCDY